MRQGSDVIVEDELWPEYAFYTTEEPAIEAIDPCSKGYRQWSCLRAVYKD